MLMIGNWPKGFPLRSKVIDYLSPPAGKHTGILTQFQTKVNKKRPKRPLNPKYEYRNPLRQAQDGQAPLDKLPSINAGQGCGGALVNF